MSALGTGLAISGALTLCAAVLAWILDRASAVVSYASPVPSPRRRSAPGGADAGLTTA